MCSSQFLLSFIMLCLKRSRNIFIAISGFPWYCYSELYINKNKFNAYVKANRILNK